VASSLREIDLNKNPINGDYSLQHMQAIHAYVFKDVYDWAGQTRTVPITKGIGETKTAFALVDDIPKDAAALQKKIQAANFLRGLEREDFSSKMGELYKQVNDLHPFREGNGRVARQYLDRLADGAGYKLNYSGVTRQEWNRAAIESAKGNLDPMKSVFNEISTPTRAIAFDRYQKNQALGLALHPELDGAFKMIADARTSGKDVAAVKDELLKQLRQGKIVDGGVTPTESLNVINHAARTRGLTAEPSGSGNLGKKYSGTVEAQSSHHVLLKVNNKDAVVFQRNTLSEQNLKVGDRLTLQNQPQKQNRGREIASNQGLERTNSFTTPKG
jgi:cell filamentation protein